MLALRNPNDEEMKRLLRFWALAAILVGPMFLTNCGSDDGAPQVVTQLVLVFTPISGEGTETLRFTYRGDALDQSVVSKNDIVLDKITLYDVELLMQSEIGISPIDLTGQIRSESDEWQIFYNAVTQPTIVDWNYADSDVNALPVGIDTRATVQGAGSGTVTITVKEQRKQEDGTATKVSGFEIEDGATAPGETKIEITFNFAVE